jgi:[ribosomal protein S18]-alanine N-acetyltransferase
MTSPADFRIRPMNVDDLESVIALERASETAPHWSRAQYQYLLEDTQPGRSVSYLALVAEMDDRVAGFVVVRMLLISDGGEAEVESILVAPHARTRGIASALLAESFDRARRSGIRRLNLEVRASNAAALRLYARAGFLRAGLRRQYYRDPGEDAVLMSIDLQPGS